MGSKGPMCVKSAVSRELPRRVRLRTSRVEPKSVQRTTGSEYKEPVWAMPARKEAEPMRM